MKTVALELQPCLGNRSGIGTYAWELSRRMQDDDDLHFCGTSYNFLGRRDRSSELEGIRMPVTEGRILPYWAYRRIWKLLPIPYHVAVPAKADLFVFFNYIVPPRIKGKVLTTVCDMTWLRFPETMASGNRHRLTNDLERSIRAAERIITISEFSKREIAELLAVPEEHIVVVPCAAHFSDSSLLFEQVAARYRIRQPYLLYIGTLEPRKNLVRLLHAFEQLKQREHIPHQLVLAGGKGWNTEAFDTALAASSVKEDIVLTGFISEAEKNTLYQNAELFVFPSLYEGFGIPPLEAMHWNCPVVAANTASLPEVCGDAAAFVEPTEEESIADGIRRILSDTAYADSLRKKGRQQEKKYSWDASAELLHNLCHEVLYET